MATIGQKDHWNPELGFAVGEVNLHGNGIATEAVNLLCDILHREGYKNAHTTVLRANKASVRVLEKCGS